MTLAYLAGAVVQRVDRPSPFCFVLSLRSPGRSHELAIIAARPHVAIGEVAESPRVKGKKPDAETMRWRKLLEGARVVAVEWREDTPRRWYRLRLVRAGEPSAVVATRDGIALLLDVGAAEDSLVSPKIASQLRLALEDDAEELAALATSALERTRKEALEGRRRALVGQVARVVQKLERRIQAVDGDLSRIGEAESLTERGALLSANAHLAKRGARELAVDDWSTGEAVRVTLALDPSKSAREQADALFHRAKRLKRGAAVAMGRRAEAERALAQVRVLVAELLAAPSHDALDVLASRAEKLGIRAPKSSETSRKEATPARVPFHVFRSSARTIYVGKNAKDNDALTTQVARPHDLWLHAKGTTGAHVVVPLEKTEVCPPELLVDAAHLAAHFSSARGEQVVEVSYVPRRYVRKPRGSAVGSVSVEREKVLVLRVEPERLRRLLAAGEGEIVS